MFVNGLIYLGEVSDINCPSIKHNYSMYTVYNGCYVMLLFEASNFRMRKSDKMPILQTMSTFGPVDFKCTLIEIHFSLSHCLVSH